MGDVLQSIARLLPLTYLGDALRQVMVDGTPFAPLWVDVTVLVVWLVACSGSPPASSSGSSRHHVPVAATTARRGRCRRGPAFRRPCSAGVRSSASAGMAEREQVLAVVVVGVAEELPRKVVLVDGGRKPTPIPSSRRRASCSRRPCRGRDSTDSGLSAAFGSG
jgi:hypothetical protein